MKKVAKKVQQSGNCMTLEDGLCPFTASKLYEDRSMFQVLMQDDRISNELVVNLIMALFRTGIDSVSIVFVHTVSFTICKTQSTI